MALQPQYPCSGGGLYPATAGSNLSAPAGYNAIGQVPGAVPVGQASNGGLINTNGSPVSGGGSVGTFANAAALEAAFPAAENAGRTGLVGASAPYTEYISYGVSWVLSYVGASTYSPKTPPARRTSQNLAADTTDLVLDTYTIPAGSVDATSVIETQFFGLSNTGIVAAHFTLRMNGIVVAATTGNSANRINSFVSRLHNIGVLNAQVAPPSGNLNQSAGQGSVSGTESSYAIDFSANVTVTLAVRFASTASGMWAERQMIQTRVYR